MNCECKNLGLAVCGNGNKYVCFHNSLAYQYPYLLNEWNWDKNVGINPMYVCKSSSKKVWWKCAYNHEWETIVSGRTGRGYGCPYCVNKKVDEFSNFTYTHPHLFKEWNFELNEISPYTLSYGSGKKIWWNCLAGLNHPPYKTSLNSRTADKCGCRLCGFITTGNSVKNNAAIRNPLINYPDICKEWHPTLNNTKPDQYGAGSIVQIWWQCLKNTTHIWQTSINTRVSRDSGCPLCYCSKGENIVRELLTKYNFSYTEQFKISQLPNKRYDFCVYYNSRYYIIEYDGIQHFEYKDHFHRTYENYKYRQYLDQLKTYYALVNNCVVIRLSYKCLEEKSIEQHIYNALTSSNKLYLSHPNEYNYLFT